MKEIIYIPSKHDSIVACLAPCLSRLDKLEGANFECINGNECSKCGFRQLWSGGVRNSLLKQNDELRVNTILDGPEWKESKIRWRHYTQQVANAISQNDDETNEYSPSDGNNARNLVVETASGNLVEFIDKYEDMTEKHAYHRHLVSTERTASIAYNQNVRPFMISRDQDFAENGSIKNKHQVQSQYWITISYTIFISCVTWVQTSE